MARRYKAEPVFLAKLSTPDRRLAEAQKVCPVLGTRLGAMGRPFKVLLKAHPIFLCCPACEKEAKGDPGKMLAEVEKQKAGAPKLGR